MSWTVPRGPPPTPPQATAKASPALAASVAAAPQPLRASSAPRMSTAMMPSMPSPKASAQASWAPVVHSNASPRRHTTQDAAALGWRPDQRLLAPTLSHPGPGMARRTSTPITHSVSLPVGPLIKQPASQRPRLPLSSGASSMPYPRSESPKHSQEDGAARASISQHTGSWSFAPPKREGTEAQGGSFRPGPSLAVGHWLPAEKAGTGAAARRGSMADVRATSAPSTSVATSTPIATAQVHHLSTSNGMSSRPRDAASGKASATSLRLVHERVPVRGDPAGHAQCSPREVAIGSARGLPGPSRAHSVGAGQPNGNEDPGRESPPRRGLSSMRSGPSPPDAVPGITVPSPRGKLASNDDLGGIAGSSIAPASARAPPAAPVGSTAIRKAAAPAAPIVWAQSAERLVQLKTVAAEPPTLPPSLAGCGEEDCRSSSTHIVERQASNQSQASTQVIVDRQPDPLTGRALSEIALTAETVFMPVPACDLNVQVGTTSSVGGYPVSAAASDKTPVHAERTGGSERLPLDNQRTSLLPTERISRRLQEPPLLLVGPGSVYLCTLTVLSVVLPEPLDVQQFFSQVECGQESHSSPDVISVLPVTLVAGSVIPQVFVRVLIRQKSGRRLSEGSAGLGNIEFETAFPLADVFRRLEPGGSEEVELGLVPTGSHAGLAAIHRYCSSLSMDGVGADRSAARIQLRYAVSGRQPEKEMQEKAALCQSGHGTSMATCALNGTATTISTNSPSNLHSSTLHEVEQRLAEVRERAPVENGQTDVMILISAIRERDRRILELEEAVKQNKALSSYTNATAPGKFA